MKRISIISLWVYLALIPLSLLIPHQPKLGSVTSAGTPEGFDVTGEVIFERGGRVHIFGYSRPIAIGTAEFKTTTGKTHSSAATLKSLISGEIQHGQTRWRANWDAVILAYIPIWLVVGFFAWIGSSRKTKRDSKNRSEQGADDQLPARAGSKVQ